MSALNTLYLHFVPVHQGVYSTLSVAHIYIYVCVCETYICLTATEVSSVYFVRIAAHHAPLYSVLNVLIDIMTIMLILIDDGV